MTGAEASLPSLPEDDLAALQRALGHRFARIELLRLALSLLYPPLTPETAVARQRLEFLGDAAWNYALALAAFEEHPEASPGDLTRLRALWSSSTGLAQLARRLGIPTADQPPPLGPSDRALAELLEAVLGAVVQDGGFEAVRPLAARLIAEDGAVPGRPVVDAKSTLQMLTQSRAGRLPTYRLIGRWGPPHHPTFRVQVTAPGPDGDVHAEAEGTSRQSAEQEAARLLLQQLGHLTP